MPAAPFSLYLTLEEGRSADIEVVARAILHLSRAIKEAAFVIDPSIDIRMELVSGTQASLSLNSMIRSMGITDEKTIARLSVVALIALGWFGNYVADKGADAVIEALMGNEPELATLTQQDKEEIAALVKGLNNKTAENQVKEVYRALEEDTAITGVGATTEPGEKPDNIVPRSEFSARTKTEDEENPPKERTQEKKMRVTLISPVLKPESRSWKFLGQAGEFWAHMNDADFLGGLLSGKKPLPMVGGIEMDVTLKTLEEFIDGVWHVTERQITRVIKTYDPPTPMFPLPPAAKKKASKRRSSGKKPKKK